MTSCEQVRHFFQRCRRSINDGAASMQIDLRHITAADTKLAACLVAVFQLASAASVRMELRLSPTVQRTLEVCRLGWLIERTAPQA